MGNIQVSHQDGRHVLRHQGLAQATGFFQVEHIAAVPGPLVVLVFGGHHRMGVQKIELPAGSLVDKACPHQRLAGVRGLAGAGFGAVRMPAGPENAGGQRIKHFPLIGNGHVVGNAFYGVGIQEPLVARMALLHQAADVQVSFVAPDAVTDLLDANNITVQVRNHVGHRRCTVAPIALRVGNYAGLPLLHKGFPGTGGANVVGPHLEGLGRGQQGNKEEQKQKFSHSTVIVPLFTQPVSVCVAVEYRPVIALVLRVPCEGTSMVRAPLKVHPERPMSLPSP